jgi:hypothetical protein
VAVLVALPDHDLEPAAGELVHRGVVLGDADGVEQREDRDPGRQQYAVGRLGQGAEEHRRRRGDELAGVALPDGVGVEPEPFGAHRRLDHALEALVHADDLAGHRVWGVRDDVEDLEAHGRTPWRVGTDGQTRGGPGRSPGSWRNGGPTAIGAPGVRPRPQPNDR